jgi:regulator of protease activity HflC (stomatin/prohibitin superfamily)
MTEMAVPQATEDGEPVSAVTPPYLQLTQARAPLGRAAEAMATSDELGRFPVVVLVKPGSRFRLELIALGALLIGGVFALPLTPILTILGIVGAIALLAAASTRAVLIPIPEGTKAVLTQAGRLAGTLSPGIHPVRPTTTVSHIVATREVPFSALARSVTTADDVRIDVQILVTFRIEDPAKFVYNTTAPDFDVVCQGAAQTAIRVAARRVESARALDLAATESDQLRDAIGEHLEPFGVTVTRVLIVRVDPPPGFLTTLEATRLAVLQASEHDRRFELDRRVQTDRERLALQEAQARLARELEEVELEAQRETLRLARLEERLATYPHAAQWLWASERLDVARALAGNSRAMIQVGGEGDVVDALLKGTLMDSDSATPGAAPSNGERTGAPPTSARRPQRASRGDPAAT